jgi:uracil phosphoribosyltransferase
MAGMFKKKAETIQFGDFMSGEYKHKRKPVKTPQRATWKESDVLKWGSIIPVSLLGGAIPAMASTGSTIPSGEVVAVGAISEAAKAKIIHVFDPLIELMIGLSLPIAGVMLTGGALMIMIGQKDMGMKLIMNSALGYVLVQMSPMFLDLLAGIGSAI